VLLSIRPIEEESGEMRRAVIGTGWFSRVLLVLFLAGAMAAGLLALVGTKPAGAALAVTFAPATNFGVSAGPGGITSADFNADSKLDLAVANAGADNVSVLLGDGTGGFGTATNFNVGDSPFSITSADFNGDGKLDLATTNGGSPDNVSVLLGDGTGGFGGATNFSVGTNPQGITSADFDGDGKPDLAVTNFGGFDPTEPSDTISVLHNATTNSSSTPSFTATNFELCDDPCDSGPGRIVSADFDAQNGPDLAVTDFKLHKVSVLLNDGTGSFGTPTLLSVGASPSAIVSADLDGDGDPDLATANSDSNNVSVLLGDGTGGFGGATNIPVGTQPFGIASADFNGDGVPDLAAANRVSNNVSVLLGNGGGFFGTPTTFPVGTQPIGIASTDFNGDSRPDLAATNNGSSNVSVLLNTSPLLAVIGTTPAKAATGVARDISPTATFATFSAEMNSSTLNPSTVKLYQRKKGKWRRVTDIAVNCDDSPCRTVKLDPYPGTTPPRLLAANKKYKVIITTGAEDMAGHHLAKNYSWTFTTASS
jgi:hypothetical protein